MTASRKPARTPARKPERRARGRGSDAAATVSVYRELFARSPVPMMLLDARSRRWIDVNASALRRLGYARRRFLALRPVQLLAERTGAGDAGNLDAALSGWLRNPGDGAAGVWRYRTGDGGVVDMDTTVGRSSLSGRRSLLFALHAVPEACHHVRPGIAAADADATRDEGQAVCWIRDSKSGTIVHVGPAFERVWRQDPGLLVRDPMAWAGWVHPEDRERAIAHDASTCTGGEHSIQYRIVWPDGAVRWIEDRCFPLPSRAGATAERLRVTTDVTAHKDSDAALRASEELHRIVSDLTSDYAWSCRCDADGTFDLDYLTDGFRRVTGYTLSELSSRGGWPAMIHPDDMPQVMQQHASLLRGDPDSREIRIFTRSGGLRLLRYSAVPVWSNALRRVVRLHGAAQDITESRRKEHELQALAQRLQEMSRRLMEAQEVERRRIAHELHDEVGQALTALKINIENLPPQGEGAQARQDDCTAIVDQVLRQVRDLSLDLRPSMLDDLGLHPALRWYIDRQAQRAGFRAQFTVEGLTARLPSPLETVCFRVAQEALTNVARHAGAHRVQVELKQAEGKLRLTVSDDGVGFDVGRALEQATAGVSMGLLGMRERVVAEEGRLEIESTPQQGTRVVATIPLPAGERVKPPPAAPDGSRNQPRPGPKGRRRSRRTRPARARGLPRGPARARRAGRETGTAPAH